MEENLGVPYALNFQSRWIVARIESHRVVVEESARAKNASEGYSRLQEWLTAVRRQTNPHACWAGAVRRYAAGRTRLSAPDLRSM